MTTFFTPPGYSGTAELTASNGLDVLDQGLWRFSQSGYNDGATFGLSLTVPSPTQGGELSLSAEDWIIAVVGNELTDYTDPDNNYYPASKCRIEVTGQWVVVRQPNSNSFNSQGVFYAGHTHTDSGNRDMGPTFLLNYSSPFATYVIQGADVDGGAQDTFSSQVFYCRCTESATTDNSNKEFQSNSVCRPVWAYSYSKSWQTS